MGKLAKLHLWLWITNNVSFTVKSDGKIPKSGSWTKLYRVSSDYEERSNKIVFLSPCFTYENPNEYILGKSNATVSVSKDTIIKDNCKMFHIILFI